MEHNVMNQNIKGWRAAKSNESNEKENENENRLNWMELNSQCIRSSIDARMVATN